MKTLFSIMCLLMLAGCANKPPELSRQDMLELTQRTYVGHSKDEILLSAEKILKLADHKDVKVVHLPNGLQATRPWSIYAVLAVTMGTDSWSINTSESKSGGVTVSAYVNKNVGNMFAAPTSSGDASVSSMPSMGNIVVSPALYELFWSRMAFFLGESDNWVSCKDMKQQVKNGITWGDIEPLCMVFTTDDLNPESEEGQAILSKVE